jgi:hypothetical protein
MSRSVAREPAVRKDQSVALTASSQGKSVVQRFGGEDKELGRGDSGQVHELALIRDLLRESINECVDEQTGEPWKDGAVAEHIGLKGESGAAYFSKMLKGEKPVGAKHIEALPREIRTLFATKYAQAHGLFVIVPVRGEDAARSLMSVLLGVLTQRLPEHTAGQLKASVRSER